MNIFVIVVISFLALGTFANIYDAIINRQKKRTRKQQTLAGLIGFAFVFWGLILLLT